MADENDGDLIRDPIKAEMRRQCLTQVELAEMSGMRQPSLSRFLVGHREITTCTLRRLMQALGLELRRPDSGD